MEGSLDPSQLSNVEEKAREFIGPPLRRNVSRLLQFATKSFAGIQNLWVNSSASMHENGLKIFKTWILTWLSS